MADLFSPGGKTEATASAEPSVATKKINKSRRLEELLLDDQEVHPVEELTGREVRIVSRKRSALSSWWLATLVLFVLAAVGAGLLQVKLSVRPEPVAPQASAAFEHRMPIPSRPVKAVPPPAPTADNPVHETAAPAQPLPSPAAAPARTEKLYTVAVGPFLTEEEIGRASAALEALGLQAERQRGHGRVDMIRLRLGGFPEQQARLRLNELKQYTNSAFLLPEGEQWALYAGSFHDRARALRLQQELAQQQIVVDLQTTAIEMDGTLLLALQADQQTARQVAGHVREQGLNAQIVASE